MIRFNLTYGLETAGVTINDMALVDYIQGVTSGEIPCQEELTGALYGSSSSSTGINFPAASATPLKGGIW